MAIGAILSQGPSNNERPIAYASRTLTDTEANYSTVEKEMLAIIWATKHFRPYLFGRKFKIVTDHRPLTWLMNFKEPNIKLVRWKLQLLEYDYDISYKKGSENVVADALSRITPEINTSEQDNTQIDNIQSTNKPINEFNLQIILKIGNNSQLITLIPFKNKLRRVISENTFDKTKLAQTFSKILKPNKTYAVLDTDDIFNIVNPGRILPTYKFIQD